MEKITDYEWWLKAHEVIGTKLNPPDRAFQRDNLVNELQVYAINEVLQQCVNIDEEHRRKIIADIQRAIKKVTLKHGNASKSHKRDVVNDILKRYEINEKCSCDSIITAHSIINTIKLNRIFKKFGESPWNKFMWCRLALFCQRLQQSDESISKIALEFGFDVKDNSEFKSYNKWFKKELGVTPSEYRDKVKLMFNAIRKGNDMNTNTGFSQMAGYVENLIEMTVQSEKAWEDLASLAISDFNDVLGINEAVSYLRSFADKVGGIITDVNELSMESNSENEPIPIKMAKLLSDLEYNIEQAILQKDLILFGVEREARDIIFVKGRSQHDNAKALSIHIDAAEKSFKRSLSLLRRRLLYTDLGNVDIVSQIAARFNTGVEQTLYMIDLEDPAAVAYAAMMEDYRAK